MWLVLFGQATAFFWIAKTSEDQVLFRHVELPGNGLGLGCGDLDWPRG